MSYTTLSTDFNGTASRFCKSTLPSFACRETLYSQSSQSVSRLDPALQTIQAGCFRHEDYAGWYPEQLSFNVPQSTLPIPFLLIILGLKIPTTCDISLKTRLLNKDSVFYDASGVDQVPGKTD